MKLLGSTKNVVDSDKDSENVPKLEGYGFLSFAKKFGNKYGKKLMNTATKTAIDAAKTATKKAV